MELKDIISSSLGVIAIIFTAITVFQGLVEYRKQGITKRAEIFLQMRKRLREDVAFANICKYLQFA